MKKARLIPTTIAGLLAAYIAWTIWQPGGTTVLLHLTHILFAAGAWLAAIIALQASRMFESGVSARRVWLLFGAGMTMLAISESLWLAYHIAEQPVSYPSIIDISWGIGYLPILASMVLQYRSLHVRLGPRQKLLVLTAYLGVLFVALLLTLEYILSNPGEVALLQILISAYYLVGNLGVVFLATLSLMFLEGGLVARPWVYLVSSLLLFAIGGLTFSFGTWLNMYETGSNVLSAVSDVSYLAGYLLAAAGGYTQRTLRLPELHNHDGQAAISPEQ